MYVHIHAFNVHCLQHAPSFDSIIILLPWVCKHFILPVCYTCAPSLSIKHIAHTVYNYAVIIIYCEPFASQLTFVGISHYLYVICVLYIYSSTEFCKHIYLGSCTSFNCKYSQLVCLRTSYHVLEHVYPKPCYKKNDILITSMQELIPSKYHSQSDICRTDDGIQFALS